jgi:hypothetical protein
MQKNPAAPEALIATVIGDLSASALHARLLHPVTFRSADDYDCRDEYEMRPGTVVLVDPTVEPRHHRAYAVINGYVWVGDAYADEIEATDEPIRRRVAMPESGEFSTGCAHWMS